jgi:hypothetical protein
MRLRLFLQIATELNDAAKVLGVIERVAFQKVLLGEAVDWPDDEQFESEWLNLPAYERLSAGKIEMVLLALDRELRTTEGENVTIEDELTIKHIMPGMGGTLAAAPG